MTSDLDEITKIDRWIKSYLELENIPHTDLSEYDISERTQIVLKHILENE
jgi:hypothetical protein